MKQLTMDELEVLALGCGVLGSGGGGDPFNVLPMVKYQYEQWGPAQIVSMNELTEDDLVVPISMMGAPLIKSERLPSGDELGNLLQLVEKTVGKRPTVLAAAEIGGGNAFTPFLAASRYGIPILDGDMIGRAFPRLEMSTCYLAGLNPTPAFQADCLGNTIVINTPSPETLEDLARATTVVMGSSSAVAFYLMNGLQAQRGLLAGTLTQAMQLGYLLQNQELEFFLNETGGFKLAEGVVGEVEQEIKQGFLEGKVTLLTDTGTLSLIYQNEYLVIEKEDEPLATTPDILVVLDRNSKLPITSVNLRYGLQVIVIVLPAPSIWTSTKGLELVGPEAFGYPYSYQPEVRK